MTRKLVAWLMLVFAFVLPASSEGGKPPVNVSPLLIQWNEQVNKFEALFSITNDGEKDLELSAILRFQTKTKRRWRGALLPLIPKNSTEHFKITFPADLMLKNNYTDISILVYENRYSGFLDNSANYIRIQTDRYVVNDTYQVKISQTTKTDGALTETKPVQKQEKVVVLGPLTTFSPDLESASKTPVELQILQKLETPAVAEQKPGEGEQITSGTWITIDPSKTRENFLQRTEERETLPDSLELGTTQPSQAGKPLPTVESLTLAAPEVELVSAADGKIEIRWTSKEKTRQFNLYWSDIPLLSKENSTKVAVTGTRFVLENLVNDKKYYIAVAAVSGPRESALSGEIEAEPKSTAIVEIPVELLAADIDPDDFSRIDPIQALTVPIADTRIAKEEALKRAQALEALDIQAREKLIALYIAEGKSDDIAELLSTQLDKNPENLDLSLSLSKVYHEQGDTAAALNVLTASLNRISLSARLALNQELKTSVKEGETTIKGQSEESFLANEFAKLGLSLLDKQKYQDALSAFQSLHSLAQEYPYLEYYMGKCRQGLKQYNQAKRHYLSQSKKPIDAEQSLVNLESLTEVLPFSLELQDVDHAISRYKEIATKTDATHLSKIKSQLDKLGFLMVKARDKKFGNLADLAVMVPDPNLLADIQPGQDFVVKLAVENLGRKLSEEFDVFYQLKHESGIFYEIAESDRFVGIQPDSPPFRWDKQIVLPKQAVTGNYELIVNVEQVAGADEISLNNNTLAAAASIKVIPPIAELAINFREKPTLSKVDRSQGVIVDLVVTNNGYLPSPAFSVEYQLESQEGVKYEYKDALAFPKINQRDRVVISEKQIPVPDDFAEGLYKLELHLVLEDESAEINKKNNRTASGFTFQFPDRFEGRPEAGIEHYRRLIREEPDNIRNRVKLSRYYRILGQTDMALSILNQASVYVAQHLFSKDLEQIKSTTPRFPDAELKLLKDELKRLGDYYLSQSSFQQALTSYQSLQTLDPDFPNIHRLTGHCRIGLGQYALAKSEYLTQAERTPDFQSLFDLKTALGFGSDLENMVKTRNSFLQLKQNRTGEQAGEIDLQVTELETMIEQTKTIMAREGSDLIIAIENPPGAVAIKPKEVLELEFSLNNLGKTLSNPARVHYQFIGRNGNVYDAEASTRFDRLDPEHKAVFWDEELEVPENIVGGSYQIRAVLEFEKNKADKDETNNKAVSDFLFVYSEPDIAISHFSHRLMKVQRKGSVVMTQLTWENQGGNPATKNRLLLFLENTNDTSDIKLLKEEPLQDVPAISETIVMSHELEIPTIETDRKYKLIAEIKSEGDLKENSIENNRFESNQLIGKNVLPLAIAGVDLNNRILFPGKKIDLEVRLRNNQTTQSIRTVALELRLLDEKHKTCCAVVQNLEEIPPSLSPPTKDGTVSVRDFVYKNNLEFPGIGKGTYRVEARLLSAAGADLRETSKVVRSSSTLTYGNATFRVTNFYPFREILIPGKETEFNITIMNDGENKSLPEKLEFFLEGKQSVSIGMVEIEAMAPTKQSVTLKKSMIVPGHLPQGTFTLVLKKNESKQGEAQVLRYRNPVVLQKVQPVAPQEFESFRRNETPLFTWNSIDRLTYRLAFSTDREFKEDSKIFRIPSDTWLDSKQYRLKQGEWTMVWLLSEKMRKEVFWVVEAKSPQNQIIKGTAQKIRFKEMASQ